MKRRILYLVATLMVLSQVNSFALASTSSINGPVKIAVKKYKAGNYTGCMQDCQSIVARDPSNSVAYYYLAMSYVQAGKKDEAISAYSQVLAKNASPMLKDYATTGKRCLETPEKCHLDEGADQATDIDKFIASPNSDGLSDSVRTNFEQKRLEGIKNQINNEKDMQNYDDKIFSDPYKHKSEADGKKIAQAKPSSDEIVAAIKVLQDAGINPYSQAPQALGATPESQLMNPQSAEYAQMGMLMGGENQSKDSNSMLNMLPYMMAQNKNGNPNYSPQMMQAVIMNSMMSNLNFNLDKDKDK